MLFKAEKTNWSLCCPGETWLEIVWDIDADGSYKKTVVMDVTPEKRFPDKVTTGKLSASRFTKLKGLLCDFPAAEAYYSNCYDGVGWKMTLYDAKGEVLHEICPGYIYGVPVLEQIAKLLP